MPLQVPGRGSPNLQGGKMNVSLFGNLVLGAALTFCVLSIVSYLYAWGRAKGTLVWGRRFYWASAWAGQQGSFLLWLGWSAILGLFMLKRLREYEERGMFFYLLVQLFLLFILVKRSPFALSAIQPD